MVAIPTGGMFNQDKGFLMIREMAVLLRAMYGRNFPDYKHLEMTILSLYRKGLQTSAGCNGSMHAESRREAMVILHVIVTIMAR